MSVYSDQGSGIMTWMDKKVGLALGGGGVRGFSHIGVLNVLEEKSIEIDLIVGTSAGGLIGGAYASGQSPREIQEKIDAYLQSPEFNESRLKSIGQSFCHEKKSFFQKARKFVMNRYWFAQAFFKPSILPPNDFFAPSLPARGAVWGKIIQKNGQKDITGLKWRLKGNYF